MLTSINPYSSRQIYEVEEFSKSEIEYSIKNADQQYQLWKQVPISKRKSLMEAAAVELRKNSKEYAATITAEMGKPITQSLAEVEKCALVCEFYAEHAEAQLANKMIETEAIESYVSYEPIGVILAVMPWNYPFWQVFRFAVPALMAGNVGVLKHAGNVMQCAYNIEQVFKRAGFPDGCFTNLPIKSEQVAEIIKNEKIKAVTLTGSETAGRAVAGTAGAEIKKSVLELGGNNALVVFSDANIEQAVKTCLQARFQNTGQSCIAGKRLLVHTSIAKEFIEKFLIAVGKLKVGNPLDADTFISVMARVDLAEELEHQMNKSVNQGAKILIGGKRDGAFFEPTVLGDVTNNMTVFTEETFGPVIGITTFESEEEAIALVNQSKFGLGVSIFTEDLDKARRLVPRFEDGAVFVNELVKSDPRLPFGGTKTSGYGRELSSDGIQEFVNKKTVYINKY